MVADSLQQKGIEVYCPLRKVKRKWSDRIKIIEEPLFRSYCFVKLEEKDRHLAFGVPGVVRYLFWLKKPAIVRQVEIDTIKYMLNNFDHDLIEVIDLKVADRLRINSGVMMDLEGEVVDQHGKLLIVKIDSIGLCISIDPRKNKLEKIG
ncbi:UpxY family transcription antiterminator [Rhabdobacter roseus]|uniref:Transcription antitermination factor NusG n=2 Tax=Rhabdobacter roseus TaxID=1655419 RepID=A0A840TGJ4_9BACT|nr:transcription antitermination factor NusG [Rhabdobacter roseus]